LFTYIIYPNSEKILISFHLKEATQSLNNFHCKENGTNSPILPVVDYKKEGEAKDYFVEVNGILHYVQENSYKLKILALFSIVGISGVVYLGLIVFSISWSCLHYKQKRKSTNLQTIDV